MKLDPEVVFDELKQFGGRHGEGIELFCRIAIGTARERNKVGKGTAVPFYRRIRAHLLNEENQWRITVALKKGYADQDLTWELATRAGMGVLEDVRLREYIDLGSYPTIET